MRIMTAVNLERRWKLLKSLLMNRMNGHTSHEFICLLVRKIAQDLALLFSLLFTLNGMHDKLLATNGAR